MNRTDELRSCPLYRRLAPRKWLPGVCFAVCMLGALLVAAAGFAEAYDKYFAPDAEADWQVLAVVILRTLTLAVPMLVGAFVTNRQARERSRRQEQQLAQLATHQILTLQEEISAAKKEYGSFYLLREYVYAPRERLLIRYADIARWSTTYNVNGFRTAAQIRTRDGSYHHIGIWQDRRYEKEYDSFMEQLDAHMQRAEML